MPKRPHRAASSSHQSKAGDTGPADRRTDPLAVSLGASETAGLRLASELTRQGHAVTMMGGLSLRRDRSGNREFESRSHRHLRPAGSLSPLDPIGYKSLISHHFGLGC